MRRRCPITTVVAVGLSLVVSLTAACDSYVVVQPDQSSNGAAKVYYVSNQGDDDADGSTDGTAFRTVGRALEAVQPGDTVLILPGTYNEALTLEGAGAPGAPITIRGEGAAILDGRETMTIGFWCENCRNIVIENLEVRGYTDIGVGALASSDITMRNLVVHDNGFDAQLEDWDIEGYGIQADESQNVTIENNDVYRNGPQPGASAIMGTGIDTFGITDSVIRNNRSHHNVGGGILVEDSVNVLVEGNEVFSNDLDASAEEWWDGGIWLDGGHDVTIRGNVFKNNKGPGIQISDEDHQQPYGYVVENNTSTENYFGIYIWNFGTSDLPPQDVLRMSDNRILGNSRKDVWIVPWDCPPPDPCD